MNQLIALTHKKTANKNDHQINLEKSLFFELLIRKLCTTESEVVAIM